MANQDELKSPKTSISEADQVAVKHARAAGYNPAIIIKMGEIQANNTSTGSGFLGTVTSTTKNIFNAIASDEGQFQTKELNTNTALTASLAKAAKHVYQMKYGKNTPLPNWNDKSWAKWGLGFMRGYETKYIDFGDGDSNWFEWEDFNPFQGGSFGANKLLKKATREQIDAFRYMQDIYEKYDDNNFSYLLSTFASAENLIAMPVSAGLGAFAKLTSWGTRTMRVTKTALVGTELTASIGLDSITRQGVDETTGRSSGFSWQRTAMDIGMGALTWGAFNTGSRVASDGLEGLAKSPLGGPIRVAQDTLFKIKEIPTYAKMGWRWANLNEVYTKDIFDTLDTRKTTSFVNFWLHIDPDAALKDPRLDHMYNGPKAKNYTGIRNYIKQTSENSKKPRTAYDMRRSVNELGDSLIKQNTDGLEKSKDLKKALEKALDDVENAKSLIEKAGEQITDIEGLRANANGLVFKGTQHDFIQARQQLEIMHNRSDDGPVKTAIEKAQRDLHTLSTAGKTISDADQIVQVGFIYDDLATSILGQASKTERLAEAAQNQAAELLRKHQKTLLGEDSSGGLIGNARLEFQEILDAGEALRKDLNLANEHIRVIEADPKKATQMEGGSTLARMGVAEAKPKLAEIEKFRQAAEDEIKGTADTLSTVEKEVTDGFENVLKNTNETSLNQLESSLKSQINELDANVPGLKPAPALPPGAPKPEPPGTKVQKLRDASIQALDDIREIGNKVAEIRKGKGTSGSSQWATQQETAFVERDLTKKDIIKLRKMQADGKITLPKDYDVQYRPGETMQTLAPYKNDLNKPSEQAEIEFAYLMKEGAKDPDKARQKIGNNLEALLNSGDLNRALEAIKWQLTQYGPARDKGINKELLSAVKELAKDLESQKGGKNPFTPEIMDLLTDIERLQWNMSPNNFRKRRDDAYPIARMRRYGAYRFNELDNKDIPGEYRPARLYHYWTRPFVIGFWPVHTYPREFVVNFLGGRKTGETIAFGIEKIYGTKFKRIGDESDNVPKLFAKPEKWLGKRSIVTLPTTLVAGSTVAYKLLSNNDEETTETTTSTTHPETITSTTTPSPVTVKPQPVRSPDSTRLTPISVEPPASKTMMTMTVPQMPVTGDSTTFNEAAKADTDTETDSKAKAEAEEKAKKEAKAKAEAEKKAKEKAEAKANKGKNEDIDDGETNDREWVGQGAQALGMASDFVSDTVLGGIGRTFSGLAKGEQSGSMTQGLYGTGSFIFNGLSEAWDGVASVIGASSPDAKKAMTIGTFALVLLLLGRGLLSNWDMTKGLANNKTVGFIALAGLLIALGKASQASASETTTADTQAANGLIPNADQIYNPGKQGSAPPKDANGVIVRNQSHEDGALPEKLLLAADNETDRFFETIDMIRTEDGKELVAQIRTDNGETFASLGILAPDILSEIPVDRQIRITGNVLERHKKWIEKMEASATKHDNNTPGQGAFIVHIDNKAHLFDLGHHTFEELGQSPDQQPN